MRKDSAWKSSIVQTLKENANLITAFTALVVLFSGIAIVNNPSQWWVPLIGISSIFLIIFLMMNARVIIKSTVAFIAIILLASFGLQLGFFYDPLGSAGFSWMSITIAIPLALLGISYLFPRGRSRWGSLTASSIAGFFTTYILLFAPLNIYIDILIGALVNIAFFLVPYYVFGKTRYKKDIMPQNGLTKNALNSITTGLMNDGWNVSVLNYDEESNEGQVLTWKDNKAFLLVPSVLDNELTLIGSAKKPSLGYNGKSINPWLLNIIYNKIPSLRSKNAPITPVILDMRSSNGNNARSIGASLPDTKKRIPVVISPALNAIQNNRKMADVMDMIIRESSEYSHDLKPKHLKALDKFSRLSL